MFLERAKGKLAIQKRFPDWIPHFSIEKYLSCHYFETPEQIAKFFRFSNIISGSLIIYSQIWLSLICFIWYSSDIYDAMLMLNTCQVATFQRYVFIFQEIVQVLFGNFSSTKQNFPLNLVFFFVITSNLPVSSL